jgi:hypothetical protein
VAENLIERYLADIGEIRGTRANVPETSFYPALERLLTDVGKTLSPKVRCVINLANKGAGLPDGGLFSVDQFRRKTRDADAKENPCLVQNPSRGVIEAKPPSQDVRQVAETPQIEKYWKRYGMVLVTNFSAFALIGKGPTGQPRILEAFALTDSEQEFWRLTSHPRQAAADHGERMMEYLKRVLLHNAPLAAPQDVAGILASYARDARLRIERADLPALTGLRQALEDALGLRFDGDKGEPELRTISVFQRVDGKPANPDAGDLDLTAGWGHAGKGGVTMPGKGKLVRRDDGAWDVFLNDSACWRNVPATVWEYTIGGYQVIKKWLSYREKPLLGRGLTSDEVRYVTEMARRLAVLIALQTSLDASYREVVQATYAWPK